MKHKTQSEIKKFTNHCVTFGCQNGSYFFIIYKQIMTNLVKKSKETQKTVRID